MTSFSPRGPILRHRTKGMYFGIMDWMPGGLYFLRSYFSACFQSAAFTFSHSESFIVKHRSICFGYFVKMYLSFLEIPYTTLNKCFKVHISTLRRNVLLLLGGKKKHAKVLPADAYWRQPPDHSSGSSASFQCESH